MGKETLVVASKVKAYIKEKSGKSTSGSTIDALSDEVEKLCDRAIANAEGSKRKTVMDRDVTEAVE